MACVEAESRELAWAVHNAVHAEYNYFVKEVRGFSQEEIICDSVEYQPQVPARHPQVPGLNCTKCGFP